MLVDVWLIVWWTTKRDRPRPKQPSLSAEVAKLADEVVVVPQNDYEPETSLDALTQVCRKLAPRAVLSLETTPTVRKSRRG